MSEQDDRPFRWEDLDQRLIKPELQILTGRMQKRVVDGERDVALESLRSGNAGSYVPLFFDFHEQLADEWAQGLYTLYCDAPNQQNRSVAPAFIRAVWDRVIFPFIGVRTTTVLAELSRQVARTRQVRNAVAEGEWVRRMRRFATRWRDKLEAEAVTSEYSASQENAQRAAADLLHLPAGLASSSDPIEGNPFSVGDPRHRVWHEATRAAEEQWCRLIAESESTPAGPPNAVTSCVCERIAKRFDIWAERNVHVVWGDQDLRVYDQWLVQYAEAWLRDFNARKLWSDIVPTTDLLVQLRLVLTKRVGWWKAEARRYLAEQKADSAKEDAARSKQKRGRPLDKMAATRRRIIQAVAASGVKGEGYCAALDKKGLSTSIRWQKNEDCPKNYLSAYNHADRNLRKKWRDRIAKEKNLATRQKTPHINSALSPSE
jgi:hypothetical protein